MNLDALKNPDHLYGPGSITFFFDPRTGRVDCADFPARHVDMLNRDGCRLGRQYLTPEQHDFDGIPLTRTKATFHGIVAGRIALMEGNLLIAIWNQLDEETTRKTSLALRTEVARVRDHAGPTLLSTHGYKQGSGWRNLADWLAPG